MLLQKKGLITEAREDGQRAVDLILEDLHKFQVVLMDNLMPVMNGQDAARSLRDHGYPYLIIGITGNSMEDDLDAFLGSGKHHHVYYTPHMSFEKHPLQIGTVFKGSDKNGFWQ
jgi:CheY-like chemotaxis protein